MESTTKADLKDILDIDEYINKGHKKICIYAGVGAGKSTWVKEVLSKKGNVLFITSRKATVTQDLKKSSFTKFYKDDYDHNQTLLTNAGLEYLVENLNINGIDDLDNFLNSYDYIVIDEIHSIATDSTFASSSLAVFSFVEYAIKNDKIVIGMTGTPEPIEYYLKENNWLILDYIDKCKYVHPKSVSFIKQRNVVKRIIESIDENKQVICFINFTDTILDTHYELVSKYNLAYNEIAIVVSNSKKSKLYKDFEKKHLELLDYLIENKADINGKTFDLKKERKKFIKAIKDDHEKIYTSITDKNMIPNDCKVILSTSTLREGINIFNSNMTIICDNHVLSNIIQFCGRVRLNDANVYIVDDGNQHPVTKNDWLYNYSNYEAETANKYISELEMYDSVFKYDELSKLRKHLRDTNKYLYFDCIEKKVKVSCITFIEETRLLKNFNWINELKNHCRKYNIHCSPITNEYTKKIILPNILEDFSKRKLKLFEEIRNPIINLINDGCESNCHQISKINDVLVENKIPYRFINYTETKKERRKETYWLVEKI